MLTEQEIDKIFSWKPYREGWAIDRDQINDNIATHYGDLINSFRKNSLFDTYYAEDGSLSNYLEFICYPKGNITYEGNAILVCVSLCAPIAAYGQTRFNKKSDLIGRNGLFRADKIGEIADITLMGIKNEIKSILIRQDLLLLDKEFASRQLPIEVADALKYENHNSGNQYLHGIFQKTD